MDRASNAGSKVEGTLTRVRLLTSTLMYQSARGKSATTRRTSARVLLQFRREAVRLMLSVDGDGEDDDGEEDGRSEDEDEDARSVEDERSVVGGGAKN